MAGVTTIRRERARRQRAFNTRHTKAETAKVLREMALSNLRLVDKYPDDDHSSLIANANEVLEHVGTLLCDLPRSGWYPKRPRHWTS